MNKGKAGEFDFTAKDFQFIAKTLHDETGIALQESKSMLVYSRLAKRLRHLGLENFHDYCALISESGNAELPEMCAALTTNVTRFFRESHHFDHLREKVLPPLLAAARSGKKVRIWSAGCSSGEEPYSIALTILQLLPDARAYDIRILATDINTQVLETGRLGRYREQDMDDVAPALRNSWTERVIHNAVPHLQLDDAVMNLVSFKQLNLNENWPFRGPFQVIFCRNVVIYFDEATQSRLWGRMMTLLDPNGVLYIGHSERVSGVAITQTNCEATTTYRKTLRSVA